MVSLSHVRRRLPSCRSIYNVGICICLLTYLPPRGRRYIERKSFRRARKAESQVAARCERSAPPLYHYFIRKFYKNCASLIFSLARNSLLPCLLAVFPRGSARASAIAARFRANYSRLMTSRETTWSRLIASAPDRIAAG